MPSDDRIGDRPDPSKWHTLIDPLLELDAAPELDRIIRNVSEILDCDAAAVSIIDDGSDRQKILAQTGLAEPWASRRETPLSHSICRDVRNTAEVLSIEDLAALPSYAGHPAVHELEVRAYLGAPIRARLDGSEAKTIGAICGISATPRRWTEADLLALLNMAMISATQIEELLARRRSGDTGPRTN